MNITISNEKPTASEFAQLRAKVGWGETDLNLTETGLDNSLFHVSARLNDRLVGMGRVIGDGALFFYIQDLVIDPEYQHQGIGAQLMSNIEQYLATSARKGATIGLFSAKGKEGFYRQFGYCDRTGEPLGLGMCKFV